MSKLNRNLLSTLRRLEHKQRWYHDVYEDIRLYLDNCALTNLYYKCRGFVRNIKLFTKLAWNWRPWDSHYTLKVLCTLLEEQAKVIKVGYNMKAEELYRRCMTASGKIDRAYNKNMDKTIIYLMDKNPHYTEKHELGYRLTRKFNTDERIYEGMYKVARNRSDKAEAEAKKEAWEYLHKYIEYFWD